MLTLPQNRSKMLLGKDMVLQYGLSVFVLQVGGGVSQGPSSIHAVFGIGEPRYHLTVNVSTAQPLLHLLSVKYWL